MLDLAIKWVKRTSLRTYGKNAKRHPSTQIEQLAASIRDHGWNSPIVVDESLVIIAGHGRLLAAEALGLELVPIIQKLGLSEEDKIALRISDNKIAEQDWNFTVLRDELYYLDAHNYDLESCGFTNTELERTMIPESNYERERCPACGK